MGAKTAYPIVLIEDKSDKVPFYVNVPDFGIDTQGLDIADAIEMARDAISLMIIDLEDDKRPIPAPGTTPPEMEEGAFVSYVDVDPEAYRRSLRNRSVKKNCTLPQWLSEKAEAAGLNFSRVLQDALMEKLELA